MKTTMIIDNRATAKKAYEAYEIDRNEWKTMSDLENLVADCMNKEVYKITVYEGKKEIICELNTEF